jgi:hypothetical protein
MVIPIEKIANLKSWLTKIGELRIDLAIPDGDTPVAKE